MKPVAFASFNKQGDITRTVKNADAWSKTALFTADQVAEAVRAEREACAQVCDARANNPVLSNHRRCDADVLAQTIRRRGAP